MNGKLSRRGLLRTGLLGGTAVAAGSSAWPNSAAFAADEAQNAAAIIDGKDARLIVHKAAPCEIETPGELLLEHPLTPKELLFVRNNQQLADSQTLAPSAATEWPIEFDGLVEFPRTVDLKELREFPQFEREMVLQCSGNGRKLFSEAAPCPGAPWHIGAVANVKFRGPTLRCVVKLLKLNVDPRAKFITAEGSDGPPKPEAADFEHSLPIGDALDRSLIALTMNGEPLPAAHGGPVRLVTPGYYGTMHVKWLSRIRFETSETANHHQVRRYRTPYDPIKPGAEFQYDLGNSEPNWRMRIKSIILSPADDAMIEPAAIRDGKLVVRGVAFNDGTCRIDRVEISTDGETWRPAELEVPESLYAWYRWKATVEAKAGEQVIRCRAIDALGRTQPRDGSIHWNPAGYAWNGVHEVKVNISR
jgi:sulfite oxidase